VIQPIKDNKVICPSCRKWVDVRDTAKRFGFVGSATFEYMICMYCDTNYINLQAFKLNGLLEPYEQEKRK
jgi:C4-type Zn-finger protein